jgi:hypothetical protein
MQCCDRSLHLVLAGRAQSQCAVEHAHPFGDPVAIPQCPVLVLQQDQSPGCIRTGVSPRVLQEHQRQQAEHFGLVGHQQREQLRQPDRLFAEVCPHERLARRRRVALVEDEVENCENGPQAFRQ